jgi:hypothetical protein
MRVDEAIPHFHPSNQTWCGINLSLRSWMAQSHSSLTLNQTHPMSLNFNFFLHRWNSIEKICVIFQIFLLNMFMECLCMCTFPICKWRTTRCIGPFSLFLFEFLNPILRFVMMFDVSCYSCLGVVNGLNSCALS